VTPAEAVAQVERACAVRTTPCGAGRMVWRLWGEDGAPPLVLLHGDFGAWTHWLRCIPALSERFRVIAPDLPGYGESDTPPEPWSPESLAAILAAGLADLLPPPRRYHLAGFSFGCIIAGPLAAREGERVESLVLLGSGGLGFPRAEAPPLRRIAKDMDAEALRAAHRHNLAALMFAYPATADDLALHLQIGNVRRARLRAGALPESDALLAVLPRVRARLCGIWGERDAFASARIRDRDVVLRRIQPGLDFRVIAGAGHWTPYEAPDAVVAAMIDMLAPGALDPASVRR
jgi:2-hydroxy-6-oxonona-2,4-dienedioate hydrolase